MSDPPDRPTSQERYGLLLLETPRILVVEEIPRGPLAGAPASAPPDARARAERIAFAGFALTYLTTYGWFALRAVRWLIDG